jgi:hypothetical protein
MLTGKQFKLLESVLALDDESKRGGVQLPSGAMVKVVSGPHGYGDRLVDVVWDGRRVSMFASDIEGSLEIKPTRKRTTSGYGSTGAA